VKAGNSADADRLLGSQRKRRHPRINVLKISTFALIDEKLNPPLHLLLIERSKAGIA
jgi:hypothetical protein